MIFVTCSGCERKETWDELIEVVRASARLAMNAERRGG